MGSGNAISRAAAQFQREELHAAAQTCQSILIREPDDGDAMHLLGLVARRLGELDKAEVMLRRSVELRPGNAEYRINLSNLYVALGRLNSAEQVLRSVIADEPHNRRACLALARVLNQGHAFEAAERLGRALVQQDASNAEAWSTLGDSLREQARLEDAESCFREALRRRPDYAVAQHNLGAVLARMRRADEALQNLNKAAQLGVRGPHIDTNRASALTELGRAEEAESLLAAVVRVAPTFVDAQERLAKLRFVRGDTAWLRDLETAAAADSGDLRLALLLGDLLRRSGESERALELLERVTRSHGDDPSVASSLAVVLQECGRLDEARSLAEQAHNARPLDAAIAENLTAILLQSARPEPACSIAREWRARAPLDQRWITYEATAAALIDADLHRALFDYERFVGVYDIAEFLGETADVFNRRLAERLTALHEFSAHPLDQSLRNGTQTPRELTNEDDPVIRQFFESIRFALREYCATLPSLENHPFLSRNIGVADIVGSWSVRLTTGGFHVNHIHPQGWISSAFYVEVPEEVQSRTAQSGWLQFGAPRMPVPGVSHGHVVQPRNGRLVLFPSYMWHGTTPLSGSQARLTIAFDALPSRQREE